MTVRERVEQLVDFLKTNPPIEEVYMRFYADNMVFQENLLAPRYGRALSIERQQHINANIKEVHDFNIGAVLFDRDHSVMEINLNVVSQDGNLMNIEKLSMQTWQEGYIIHERLFYDSVVVQDFAKEFQPIN